MPNVMNAASAATAEGLVTVDGRTFPLRSAAVHSHAQGGLALTTLRQEFANSYAEPLEVLYTMPLPADGAVVGYTFRLGERVVRGQIEAREKARAAYRQALLEGKTAGLLEQERADTFTQSLGNLPAGTAVGVEIEVLHPVAFLPGVGGTPATWEWRFPTVVSARYGGGQEVHPDRAEPGEGGIPARISAELTVRDGKRLTVEPQRLDRDLVFAWPATSDETAAAVVEGPGLPGDDGRYAMVVVTPPSVPTAVAPRDLTILLDTSGSMSGVPLQKAKAVVVALLESLQAHDRFEVLAFSDTVERVTGAAQAERWALEKAWRALDGLRAGGGTEMTEAVQEALTQEPRPGEQRQIVLITDGCVGFEREVETAVRYRLPGASRMHVVGIGEAANRALTRATARAGRGLEVIVGLKDDPAKAAARLVRGTVAPVLTEVKVRGTGLVGIAPKHPRDVFAGEPLKVFAHVGTAVAVLEVSGRLAGSAEMWTQRFELGGERVLDGPALPLGAAYAREAVDDLETAYHEPDDEAIEAVGLRHRIVTRRTSLVAISEEPTVDPHQPGRRTRLPVELPYGVSAEGVGLIGGGMFFRRARSRDFGISDTFNARMPADELAFRLGDAEEAPAPRRTKGRFGGVLRSFLTRSVSKSSLVDARIVRWQGDALVIELEAPEGGIDMPKKSSELIVMIGRTAVKARLESTECTKGGHHAAGTTVRIAMTLESIPPAGAKPSEVAWGAGGRAYLARLK